MIRTCFNDRTGVLAARTNPLMICVFSSQLIHLDRHLFNESNRFSSDWRHIPVNQERVDDSLCFVSNFRICPTNFVVLNQEKLKETQDGKEYINSSIGLMSKINTLFSFYNNAQALCSDALNLLNSISQIIMPPHQTISTLQHVELWIYRAKARLH